MVEDCVMWPGRVNRDGYGVLGVELVHRRFWSEANGPIPDGMTIDHICHDPEVCREGVRCVHRRCVNPRHLQLLSSSANKGRGGSSGEWRTHCPAGHPYAGDNLAIYGGARYCLACRRTKQQARRDGNRVEVCRLSGHERVERRTESGRVYCAVCVSEASARGAEKRREARRPRCPAGHGYAQRPDGRQYCPVCTADAQRGRGRTRAVARCRERGHERQEQIAVDGRVYCAVCAQRPKGVAT